MFARGVAARIVVVIGAGFFRDEVDGLARVEALDALDALTAFFAGFGIFPLVEEAAPLLVRRVMEEVPLVFGVEEVELFFLVFATPVLAGNNLAGVDFEDPDTGCLGRSFILCRTVTKLDLLLRFLVSLKWP